LPSHTLLFPEGNPSLNVRWIAPFRGSGGKDGKITKFNKRHFYKYLRQPLFIDKMMLNSIFTKHTKLCFIIVLIIIAKPSIANYDFNSNCKQAYNNIINLNFIQAKVLIANEIKANPDNLITHYLNNTIDFLSIVISENPDVFNTLKSNKDKRIDLLQNGDNKSPYYRYCLAEVYLQWAAARIIFDEYVTAAYEINKAYRLLKKNNEEFPSFTPNFKSLGLLNSLIGSIPDEYKWVVKIIGSEGTLEQGINQLAIVLKASAQNEEYNYLNAETVFLMAYVSMNLENKRENVLALIRFTESNKKIGELVKSSALVNFGVANLYIRTKINTDKGIGILSDFEPCNNCFTFSYRFYANGLARLNRLDKDADIYFESYLKNYKGQNFIKAAYQKIAWHCLINDDTLGYHKNMSKAKLYGKSRTDDDKLALSEAKRNLLPNVILLKARLLFDGGYYKKALDLLAAATPEKTFKSKKDNLEYYYRLARIYHEKGDTVFAVTNYITTIKMGEEEVYYYAANACLQLGLIYENQHKYELALQFFNKAMNLENTEYKNSIDQKAKAGLARLKF